MVTVTDQQYRKRQQDKIRALSKFGIEAHLTDTGLIALDSLAADIAIARLATREQKHKRHRPRKGKPC